MTIRTDDDRAIETADELLEVREEIRRLRGAMESILLVTEDRGDSTARRIAQSALAGVDQ